MAVLPNQILPEAMPFTNEDGTNNHNWWLFLYNLSQHVLGNGSDASALDTLAQQIIADLDLSPVLSDYVLAPYLNNQQTAAEIAANVTPVNFGYAPGNVLRYGADPTGVKDSSAAIIAATSTNYVVVFPFGVYQAKNITVGTNVTIYLNGSTVNPAPGANYVFLMTGFKPTINDGYFNDALSVIPGTLTTGFVVVQNCYYPSIFNTFWVNQVAGLVIGGDAVGVTDAQFTNLRFINFSARGILILKNASNCTFVDVDIDANLTAPSQVPKAGTIGFQHVPTGSTVAYGGHLLDDVVVLNAEYGFQFTGSNLVSLQNCIADTCSQTGYQLTGACDKMTFDNCFAGTCKWGYDVADTCSNVTINNAVTELQGFTPPFWVGPTPFFDADATSTASSIAGTVLTVGGSITGSFVVGMVIQGVGVTPYSIITSLGTGVGGAGTYNLSQASTVGSEAISGATTFDFHFSSSNPIKVGVWKSDAYLLFSSSVVDFDPSDSLFAGTAGTVAAASTVYLTYLGAQAIERPAWVMSKNGFFFLITAQCDTAPGVANSFTYNVRKNYAASGISTVITGAGSFGNTSNSIFSFAAGDNLDVQLVTSAGAAAANHRLVLGVRYT